MVFKTRPDPFPEKFFLLIFFSFLWSLFFKKAKNARKN